MELIYRGRHIHSLLKLNLEMDCWVPNADVSWEEGDSEFHQLLTGPVGYCKIIDQAELYAVEMAKTWIDAECTRTLSNESSESERSEEASYA
ncbi:MAG TPA: hypothetical protein VF452_17585 [Candidatus Binatia bacterium]